MLENDDEATACRNYDDVDDAEVNEFECRSRCRMKMIRVIKHSLVLIGLLAIKDDILSVLDQVPVLES